LAAQEVGAAVLRPNIRISLEVVKPQVFDGITEKVLGFVIVCKLFLRIRIREDTVEEQI